MAIAANKNDPGSELLFAFKKIYTIQPIAPPIDAQMSFLPFRLYKIPKAQVLPAAAII